MNLLDKIIHISSSNGLLADEKFKRTFAGQSILITGGTGFVGSHFTEAAQKLGANVTVVALNELPGSYFSVQDLAQRVKLHHFDLTDFELLKKTIGDQNFDYVFHFAAQPLVDIAYKQPRETIYTNIVGTLNILDFARQKGNVKAVVIASSDKSYGKLDKQKYTEQDPVDGQFPYDVSKSAVDLISKSYFRTYQTPVTITRFGNIYGAGDINYSRIVPKLMRCIIKGEQFHVHGDGSFVRDYLSVTDIVRGCFLLAQHIEKTCGQPFNFGSDDTLTILELIKTVEESLGKKIDYVVDGASVGEIAYQSLDFSKITATVGWQPQTTLAKELPGIYDWYAKNIT